MKGCSLLRVKKMILLLRIWFLVKLYTMRRSLSRMKMELKLNTGFGTPSDQKWLLPFLAVLMMSGSNLVAKVLYLGAASGTTVSHVSDIVGPTGVVYAVEFSHRSGRDLVNMA